jgi:hypothetical protein
VATSQVFIAGKGWEVTYLVTGGSSLQVELSANGRCWTDRWADGAGGSGTQYDLAYTGPASVFWTAGQALEVELGNASAVTAVHVNGQTMPALPTSGPNPEWLFFRVG